MIDLYTWSTPNGRKVSIMLEELGLDYNVHPINILEGDQFDPEYLKINPNNKMPSLVDPDGPDGKPYPIGQLGTAIDVDPGRHRLVARHGLQTRERELAIKRGKSERVMIDLTPTPRELALAAESQRTVQDWSTDDLASSGWFWAGTSAAVVAVVVTTLLMVRDNPPRPSPL